ncbi:SDR family oxidoreductase [Neorhizobium sp. T25_27]|uniref:SDR family oxidoreductase n=1 Tax=Neorhizobium sp. T25_27 TaxID=2093831 RepID=UPI000CFA5120|nr:SDR family oxidoreductase [Neorhizobium sp. T25_27]
MKVVVVGANGMMGSKIVRRLERHGKEVIEASKTTGVNVYTGEGLASVLNGADVVVDVTNSGAFGEGDALEFFKRAGRNLTAAAKMSGIRHYMALSVLGVEHLVENDYFRAKLVQENLIRASGLAYTIIRSAQFFEFFNGIINAASVDGVLRLPPVVLQPISADEAANWIVKLTDEMPRNTMVEVSGPESAKLVDLAHELLTATEDNRAVTSDTDAHYFGVRLAPDSLLSAGNAITSNITFHEWLSRTIYA